MTGLEFVVTVAGKKAGTRRIPSRVIIRVLIGLTDFVKLPEGGSRVDGNLRLALDSPKLYHLQPYDFG